MPSGENGILDTDLFSVTIDKINDPRADIVVSDISITYKQARVSSGSSGKAASFYLVYYTHIIHARTLLYIIILMCVYYTCIIHKFVHARTLLNIILPMCRRLLHVCTQLIKYVI